MCAASRLLFFLVFFWARFLLTIFQRLFKDFWGGMLSRGKRTYTKYIAVSELILIFLRRICCNYYKINLEFFLCGCILLPNFLTPCFRRSHTKSRERVS